MFKNSRRIIRISDKDKKIIEISDFLNINDFNEKAYGKVESSVHGRCSKIEIRIVDNSNRTFCVHHKIDPNVFSAMASQVILGNNELFDYKSNNFKEFKVDPYKKSSQDKNYYNASGVHIWFKENMWNITIINGMALPNKNVYGGVSLKKGTFKETKQSTIKLTCVQMILLMNSVKDYITEFETCHLNKMLNARNEYEKSVKNDNISSKTAAKNTRNITQNVQQSAYDFKDTKGELQQTRTIAII